MASALMVFSYMGQAGADVFSLMIPSVVVFVLGLALDFYMRRQFTSVGASAGRQP